MLQVLKTAILEVTLDNEEIEKGWTKEDMDITEDATDSLLSGRRIYLWMMKKRKMLIVVMKMIVKSWRMRL